jgi:hypothetical protein
METLRLVCQNDSVNGNQEWSKKRNGRYKLGLIFLLTIIFLKELFFYI